MSNASSKTELNPEPSVEIEPKPANRWLLRLRGKRGSFGGPVRVVVSTFVIFIASQLLAALIVVLINSFQSNGLTTGQALNRSPGLQFVYIFVAEALAIGLVLFVLRRRGLQPAAVGFGRRPVWKDLKWAFAGFAAFYAIWIVVAMLISWLLPGVNLDQTQDIGFNGLAGPSAWIIAFVALVILPPLGEETLVRGYLYSGLRSSLKFLPALLITSLLFGLAHLQSGNDAATVWAAAIDTFVLSIVLVYLREKTGALYACMLVHALNNSIAFFVHFHP